MYIKAPTVALIIDAAHRDGSARRPGRPTEASWAGASGACVARADLAGRLPACLGDWLAGWPPGRLAAWLAGSPVGWLIVKK